MGLLLTIPCSCLVLIIKKHIVYKDISKFIETFVDRLKQTVSVVQTTFQLYMDYFFHSMYPFS